MVEARPCYHNISPNKLCVVRRGASRPDAAARNLTVADSPPRYKTDDIRFSFQDHLNQQKKEGKSYVWIVAHNSRTT